LALDTWVNLPQEVAHLASSMLEHYDYSFQ